MAKASVDSYVIDIPPITTDTLISHFKSRSPMIFNAPSEKSWHEFIWPGGGRRSVAARAASLKHNPPEEYRNSVYKYRDYEDAPTRIYFPSMGFKSALRTAALDIVGLAKSQVGRLCWIDNPKVSIYGIPQIFMTIVRQSGPTKTPDVRTRAIVPQWAASIEINSITPILKRAQVAELLSRSGITVGVGDFRQEKGGGSYGQYTLCSPTDPIYKTILRTGARASQDAALLTPKAFDDQTDEMLEWFNAKFAQYNKEIPHERVLDAAKGIGLPEVEGDEEVGAEVEETDAVLA